MKRAANKVEADKSKKEVDPENKENQTQPAPKKTDLGDEKADSEKVQDPQQVSNDKTLFAEKKTNTN